MARRELRVEIVGDAERIAKLGYEIHGKSHDKIVKDEKHRSFWRGYWLGAAVAAFGPLILHAL